MQEIPGKEGLKVYNRINALRISFNFLAFSHDQILSYIWDSLFSVGKDHHITNGLLLYFYELWCGKQILILQNEEVCLQMKYLNTPRKSKSQFLSKETKYWLLH